MLDEISKKELSLTLCELPLGLRPPEGALESSWGRAAPWKSDEGEGQKVAVE